MKADPQTLQQLNAVLRNALTAINQTFLHARMLGHWGFKGLEKREYEASIHEMKHADRLMGRILFLQGLPNLQDLGKLLVGEDVAEILRNDLTLASQIRQALQDAVAHCEGVGDYISREHLQQVLDHEEERIDWLETQLGLISQVGLPNYLQSAL